MNHVKRAIDHVGSEAEIARLTGVSVQAINKAKRKGKASPDLALKIEEATSGVVTKEQLVWGDQNAKAA
jgi:DNA-binding transcriptional regulator YdaS (Cro superfamily)